MKKDKRILNISGAASLTIAALIYGFYGVISRLINNQIDVFYLTWTRALFVALMFLILTFINQSWKKIKKEDWKWFILRGFASLCAIVALFIAVNEITLGATYLIFYGGTIIGGFFIGKIFFNERMNKTKFVSLILSMMGLLLIYSFNFNIAKFIYYFTALIGGFLTAMWNTFPKKISNIYSNAQINLIDAVMAVTFGIIISILLNENWVPISLSYPWLLNLLFGIGWFYSALLVVHGFSKLEVQIGTLITLLEIPIVLLLGRLIFDEVMNLSGLVGGILILAAAGLPEIVRLKNYPTKKM